MTNRRAKRKRSAAALGLLLLLVRLGAPACAAGVDLPTGDAPGEQAPAAGAPAMGDAAEGQPAAAAAAAQANPPDPAEEAKPKFIERVLRPREILGTQFRGHAFIDGLPVSPDGVQIGEALVLRRARVGFVRQLPLRWEAQGSVELSSRRVELKDLYLRRHFDRLGTVTFGNQSEPMGLNELSSQLSQPLLEPSLATALVPGRNFGIAVANRHDNFHYQVGIFGSGTEQEGRRDLGSAFTARLTHRSIDDGGDVRHFGFGLSDRKLGGAEQFRTLPEVGLGEEELVDTGTIEGASSTLRASFEYIQTFGRWSVLGEMLRVNVTRDNASRLQFGGGSIEATWMAWGQGPLYDEGDAVLARAPVTTSAHWGEAWGRGNLALTARLSRIDLSSDDIQGGVETNLSFGAAWDVSTRTRLSTNLVHFLELTGPNAAAEGSSAIAIRFQYVW